VRLLRLKADESREQCFVSKDIRFRGLVCPSELDNCCLWSTSSAGFAFFKIDQAQRHHYWTFDVGRSMFDVH